MLTGIIGDKDQLEEKQKASHKESEKVRFMQSLWC